ncbi:glutathione S-transferase family protein [Thalassotalea fusca]
MNIYSFPTFNLTKILLTAEELGENYQLHLLDFAKGEHKTEAHLARHPLGKVPAVEIDGKNYFESNAICRLLAERNNNALYGDTPEQRAIVNEWTDMATLHVGRWLTVLFFENSLKPVLFGGETNVSAVDEAQTFLSQQLPALENQLNQHDFITGNELTIADIIAFSYFSTVVHSGLDLSPYPKIDAWISAIKQRPSFKKAMSHIEGGDMFAGLSS